MTKPSSVIIKAVTSVCFVGFLPVMPGTFGSAVGIACFYLYKDNWTLYFFATFLLAVLGFMLSGKAEKLFKRKDPRYVVIDEVVGMMVSLAFVPYRISLVVAGFFLFRLLDTLKPYPALTLQNLHGSLGIMGDDIVAGIYTNFVLQVVARVISCKAS